MAIKLKSIKINTSSLVTLPEHVLVVTILDSTDKNHFCHCRSFCLFLFGVQVHPLDLVRSIHLQPLNRLIHLATTLVLPGCIKSSPEKQNQRGCLSTYMYNHLYSVSVSERNWLI